MHHVKNLNFSACVLELHSVFHVFFLVDLHPLQVALHPFTGIEQVIYRWKAAVSTQVSRVNHLFILAMILKVFHLKFIQRSSWTSCCFHVELLWRIFVCNFLIHSLVLHLSHNFFNFLRWRTWTYINKLLVFAFLLFLIQNAHHVVRELLAVINLNFSRLRENIWVFFMNF